MQCAEVDVRKGDVLVSTFSQTSTGAWIGTGETEKLSITSPPSLLGAAIHQALAASQTGVRHPRQDEWKGLEERLLKAAGVRRYSEFVKGARSVSAELDVHGLRLVPMKNMGAKGGFVHLTDKTLTLQAEATDEEVGQAILRALELCETVE